MKFIHLLIIVLLFFSACKLEGDAKKSITNLDPLPSWNEGSAKQSIIDFVERSIDENGAQFISIEDRITVFDNDGTLWSEQPLYFQLFFALDQVKDLASEHPEWQSTEPFKSVLEGNIEGAMQQGESALIQIIEATHGGMNAEVFEGRVREWMKTARHPRFKKPFTELIYQPMLEVLQYLRANNFKTYIVSGGGIGFMRPVTNELYGIPADQVVGSRMKVAYDVENKVINRFPELSFIDDKAGKPVGIYNLIGKKPVAAFGNSDGDLNMLQWTATNENSFMMYVHHTDSVREWAYDSISHIGKLKKGFIEAQTNGWTIASMQDDWKVIYPFELKK
ncbi:MAG: haloacid dehalogenase-like hydrolase [Reichenbachiella sp.]